MSLSNVLDSVVSHCPDKEVGRTYTYDGGGVWGAL